MTLEEIKAEIQHVDRDCLTGEITRLCLLAYEAGKRDSDGCNCKCRGCYHCEVP